MSYVSSNAEAKRRSRSSSLTLSALADLAEAVEGGSQQISVKQSHAGTFPSFEAATALAVSTPSPTSRWITNDCSLAKTKSNAKALIQRVVDGTVQQISAKKRKRSTSEALEATSNKHENVTSMVKSCSKRRLERNRNAAQAYRRRKKEQLVSLKNQIKELETENILLRERLKDNQEEGCCIANNQEEQAAQTFSVSGVAPLQQNTDLQLFEACRLTMSDGLTRVVDCTRIYAGNKVQVNLKIHRPAAMLGQETALLHASELAQGFVIVSQCSSYS